jgi:O-antigen/teichoic acid export membrane protein
VKRSVLGVADQVVSSGSNYLTAFLASLVLAPVDFGAFVLAYAVVTVLLAGTRAVVGEPLLAHLPTVEGSRRRGLGASALALALVLGVASALVCAAGGAWFTALLVFAAWMPAALAADAARYVLLARRDTGRALVVDTAWVVVQLAVLGGVLVWGTWSIGWLAAAWGLGAVAAVGAFLVVAPERVADPRAWWAESRYLSGWFTATSVLGQVQIYLVLLLAGAVLLAVDTAGLRAVQLMVFQPVVTLMAALLVLLTPPMAACSAAGDLAGLRRARGTALKAMALIGVLALLAIPLRHVLLGTFFPRYTDYAALVAPIALQTAVGALTVPFQAQIRGFRRGRALFAQQLVQAGALLGCAGIGIALGGVVGLAWGLAVATVIALVAIVARALRLERPVVGTPVVAA